MPYGLGLRASQHRHLEEASKWPPATCPKRVLGGSRHRRGPEEGLSRSELAEPKSETCPA